MSCDIKKKSLNLYTKHKKTIIELNVCACRVQF